MLLQRIDSVSSNKLQKFPAGSWFCCNCSCKFCEKVEAANHGTTTTLSPLLRCHLCEEKCMNYKAYPSIIYICLFSSVKFLIWGFELKTLHSHTFADHQACIKQDGTVPVESSTLPFCGKYCQEVSFLYYYYFCFNHRTVLLEKTFSCGVMKVNSFNTLVIFNYRFNSFLFYTYMNVVVYDYSTTLDTEYFICLLFSLSYSTDYSYSLE